MVSPHLPPCMWGAPTQREYGRTKRYNTERKMHKYIEWLLYEELHRLGFACLFRGAFFAQKEVGRKECDSSVQNDYCNRKGEQERSVTAQNESGGVSNRIIL